MKEESMTPKKIYSDEIDFKKIINVMWDGKLIIVAFLFAALLISVAKGYLTKPVYQSSAVVFLGLYENTINKAEYAKLVITSQDFLDKMSKDSSLGTVSADRILVSNVKENFIKITVYGDSPEQARLIVNKVSEMYCAFANINYEKDIIRIKESIAIIKSQLEEVDTRILNAERIISEVDKTNISPFEKDMRKYIALEYLGKYKTEKNSLMANYIEYQSNLDKLQQVKVIQSGSIIQNPVEPNIKRNVLFGALIGVILGLIVVFFKELIRQQRNNLEN